MSNIINQYMNTTYSIDFKKLGSIHEPTTSIQYDKILKPYLGGELIQLSTMVLELELMFDINRDTAFWAMHDWLTSDTLKYVANGGNEQASINLKYLLGWFTQMK